MIAVVSRVTQASVTVAGEVVGKITEPGLLVLLGVGKHDGADQVALISRKIAELRLLRGDASVTDLAAPVLLVSQFTLLGNTKKGRRPSWSDAAAPDNAAVLIGDVANALAERGIRVEQGRFGADMAVASVNDGPFTVIVQA